MTQIYLIPIELPVLDLVVSLEDELSPFGVV
jgi:hypothetical protein